MTSETSRECRICGQHYFSHESLTERCTFCEFCHICDGPMPLLLVQDYESACSESCDAEVRSRSEATMADALRRAIATDYTAKWRKAWREELFIRDEWKCHPCGEAVDPAFEWPHSSSPVLDHVIPKSKGGRDLPENLRTAHALCNNKRKDMDLDLYLELIS